MANLASLPILLKELKLTTFTLQWETAANKAIQEQWLPQQYLAHLCEEEVNERYQRRLLRYLREAQLPPGKQLANFSFDQAEGIKMNQITALTTNTQWVRQASNLLLFGPSGTGKTHLAAGIAYALVEQGIRVKCFSAVNLVQQLQVDRQNLQLPQALARLDRYPAIILDDIGYVRQTEQEAHVLFELIAHRYETGSLIITSNQPFSQWDNIFTDNMMTVAAIDRLVHHATILECQGESFRKKASMARRENAEK
ncbi:MAG: IS21-like element helper ATPase IstB [Thiolinea sp.]|jgi:DNA replication protein DnaC